jgi:hypothetical protein
VEAGAVVGEDAFGPDAKGAEVGNRVSQELCRARLGFVGIDVCEADAGMIVDRDEEVLPACLMGLCEAPGMRLPMRSMRPSFLVSMWIRSPGCSCS